MTEQARTSKYRGVSFHPGQGKWLMSLRVEGLYDTEEDAARAHDAVVRHYRDLAGGEGKHYVPTVGG
jgi:hypothetical protein